LCVCPDAVLTRHVQTIAGFSLLATVRNCPLAATKKTSWPSQNVTVFASTHRHVAPNADGCGSFGVRDKVTLSDRTWVVPG
jgi:hypothetical protein